MSFTPLPPPYTQSDPTASYSASTTLDLLLIELVPFTQRITALTSPTPPNSFPLTSTSPDYDESESRDALFFRLEAHGYSVGAGLVERFSRDRARMLETLDVIKFICKDLWTVAFRKQIDNLKTNHRGVYVLTDTNFRPFARMSAERGVDAVALAQPFLWFPCGVVRGALANMGVEATVHAETTELPIAIFKIEVTTRAMV